MKQKTLITMGMVALSIAGAPVLAVDQYDYAALMKRGDLGTSSQPVAAQRVLRIEETQRYLNVEHSEIVKLEDGKGRSFTWQFDTFGERSFPLRVIAPQGFEAGRVMVYVSDPYTYNSD